MDLTFVLNCKLCTELVISNNTKSLTLAKCKYSTLASHVSVVASSWHYLAKKTCSY
jgi:hypothetical protein